jgi:hypothetical protein
MFTKHFTGHFTHNKDVSPPWGALSRDKNYAYLHIDCLPSGMLLLDPSKILAEDLRLIWIHWMARQRADSQALVFLKAKPGVMREAMPQPQQSRPRKETVGTDFFDDPDNEEGPSQGPHPDSPAAHASSPASKLLFLQSLSSDKVYNTFVDLLNSKEEVSVLFVVYRLHLITMFSKKMLPLPRIFLPGEIGSGRRNSCLKSST